METEEELAAAAAALETGNTEEAAEALETARETLEAETEALEEQLAPTMTQAEMLIILNQQTERLIALEVALAALQTGQEMQAQAAAAEEPLSEAEQVEVLEEVRAVTPATAIRRKQKGFW